MKNNLMNQTVKWEEMAFLTDREMNQLAIKQDAVCQKILRDLKSIEEFLNSFEDFDCVNSFSQIHFSARQPAVTRPAYETVCRLSVSIPCSYSAFRPKWSPLHVAAWHRPASGRCFHPETRQWPVSVA